MKPIVHLSVFALSLVLSFAALAQTNVRLKKELRKEYTAGQFNAKDSAMYAYTAKNTWDSVKNDWKYDVRTDGDKRIVRSLDVDGMISNEDYQYFDRGFWWPDKRMSFEYQNKKIVKMIYQEWYGGSWQNLVRYEHTYDAMGNRIVELTLVWENAVWQNSTRHTSTYTSDGIAETLQERWLQNAWQSVSLETYTYTSGRLTERLFQVEAGGWVTARHEHFFYDHTGNDSVTMMATEDGSGGFDTTKRIYHFNSAGQQDTLVELQIMNGLEQNTSRTLLGYHSSGLIGLRSTQSWNDVTGKWYYPTGSIEQEYQYEQNDVGVEMLSARNIPFELYPVPVIGDQLLIRTGTEELKAVHISIYAIGGKLVYDRTAIENTTGLIQIDTKTFLPGSYVLMLNDGARHSSKQFVITNK